MPCSCRAPCAAMKPGMQTLLGGSWTTCRRMLHATGLSTRALEMLFGALSREAASSGCSPHAIAVAMLEVVAASARATCYALASFLSITARHASKPITGVKDAYDEPQRVMSTLQKTSSMSHAHNRCTMRRSGICWPLASM